MQLCVGRGINSDGAWGRCSYERVNGRVTELQTELNYWPGRNHKVSAGSVDQWQVSCHVSDWSTSTADDRPHRLLTDPVHYLPVCLSVCQASKERNSVATQSDAALCQPRCDQVGRQTSFHISRIFKDQACTVMPGFHWNFFWPRRWCSCYFLRRLSTNCLRESIMNMQYTAFHTTAMKIGEMQISL